MDFNCVLMRIIRGSDLLQFQCFLGFSDCLSTVSSQITFQAITFGEAANIALISGV